MQVKLIEMSATRKAMEMVFPAPDVAGAVQAALAEIAPKVRIPGFRPGKAPKGVLMSRLKNDVVRDAAARLMDGHVADALEAVGMKPISRPALAGAELDEVLGGTVSVQFDVAPEIRLPDYSDLRLVKKKRAVDDALVEASIEDMRQGAARMVPVEGAAELGHFVEFDLKYKPQGMKPKTNRDRRVQLKAGSPFDAELVGAKVDDVIKFTLQVPANDEDRAVAGKPVQHEVLVTDVRARVVPAINDEFAKDTGRYGSLAELREGVRKELGEKAENEAAARLQSDLLDRLLDAAPFEVPLSMVNLQLDDYCREFAEKLDQMGLDHKKMDWRAFRQRRANDAERAVRSGYLLQALGDADDIQVLDEEIDGEIRKWMAESGATDSFESVRADFARHGATMEIRGRLRTEKIFDAVLGRVGVTEETLDGAAYAELLEMERRRAEGQAQARFDAGGIGGIGGTGGDFEEQEGGSPIAVVPAASEPGGAAAAAETDPTGSAEPLEPDAAPAPKKPSAKAAAAKAKPPKPAAPAAPAAKPAPGKTAAKDTAKTAAKGAPIAAPKKDAAPKKPAAKAAPKKPAAPMEDAKKEGAKSKRAK
jgi:trigger factor